MASLSLADGFAALNRGDSRPQAEACKQALSDNPQHVPAHFSLALLPLRDNKEDVALRRCI